jgi:hypothetical protein
MPGTLFILVIFFALAVFTGVTFHWPDSVIALSWVGLKVTAVLFLVVFLIKNFVKIITTIVFFWIIILVLMKVSS